MNLIFSIPTPLHIGTVYLVSYLASMYQGAAIFWVDVSHRHSLWLPIGKTSGITKSQYTNLIPWIPTPLHIGTVYLVSYLA